MKKRVSLLLVIAMLLSMVPVVASAAEATTLISVTDEAVTTAGYTYEYTAETAGTLTVTAGTCDPGWQYKVYGPDYESIPFSKWSSSHDHAITAGDWSIVFYAYSSAEAGYVDGTVSFTVTFTPAEGEDSGEVAKAEYEVSDTALAVGDNTLTLLDTAVTTIYVFEPTETGVYTFTAPEGATLGYWGAGSWFLTDPGSTTNTYEWTCTGVGQSAYIGVSGADSEFTMNVAKTGDYTVVETPIVVYENKATLSAYTLPEGAALGSYVDVYGETHTAVLGDDGYYHLDSVDGDILLVDMNYQDIVLSDALKSDRPVMYAYTTDADGNKIKYDIGAAVQAYEAVMDENGYYPLTEDLILFYDTYAVGAGTYTFYVSGDYNEECVWMYCMRTMTLSEEEVDPSEPETEPSEPETEPSEPETEPSEPETEATEPSVPEETEPVDGEIVLNESVSGTSSTKYVYSYTPAADGTLTVTVGDGSASWDSDVAYFVDLSLTSIASASGTAAGTYTADVTAGTTYRVRVWSASGTATPVMVVFKAAETTEPDETEPTEPEKNAYEVSTSELAVGSNTVTMLDTAVTTIFKFKPTETGTYTVTAPEGAVAGNWGSNASYLTDPGSTTNSCEWTCTGVGQSVYIGISGAEGDITVTVEKQEEVTEPSEPETEETEPSEPETEPTTPSVPDEDVPDGTYYSITVDGTTTYYSGSSGATLNSNLKTITGTGYVKFYQDMALGSSYTVDVYNGNITIDLNGCTITSAYKAAGALYVSGGNVTLVDTSADAAGVISNTSTNGFGIEVYTGSVTVLSGNAEGYMGSKVWAASLDMQGGTLSGTSYGINALANSTVTISGGEIIQSTTGTFKYALFANSAATVTVTGGYFNGAVSGTSLAGKISGGYYTASVSAYVADGCEQQDNDDATYIYKVVDPNATDTEEPSEPETEPTDPSEPETEPSEPETEPTDPSEPVESGTLISVTDEAVTATGYTFTYTAETAGTLTVTAGECSPGWQYKVYGPNYESIPFSKWSGSHDHAITAGEWSVVFYAYSSSAAEYVDGTVSFTVTFTPAEGEEEVQKAEYEVSETALAVGDNALTLLDTAVTTIYVFEPTETGVYTFTAPEGAILGYWGAGSWFLSDPGSTTNTYEWTCTGVGQSAYIGVSGVDGEFNLNVAKTGDYTVVETPIVTYENKATLETFTLPEGATLGSYVDVYGETHTAVLGDDGYYHLDSVDGDILLVDMNYQEIVLSDALKSDRPVMYAYTTDADGNKIKYDIGAAVQAYEAVMDENGYYPLTEDLILFYDTYAVGAGTYTFYVSGDYNEECVWMYCMRTMTLPEPEPTVELTHISLNPGKDALGYKAAATNLPEGAHVEISLWVTENVVITKATDTLRLVNILACNGGETTINAKATIVDADGNVIAESAVAQTTMKDTIETVNTNFDGYSDAQKAAVKALVTKYESKMEGWNIDAIKAWTAPAEA